MLIPIKFLIAFFFFFQYCISSDTITSRNPLKDGEIIVSKGKTFALGFFSPGSSKYRYVGIWYTQGSEQTVVWVANRNHPVNDTSGVITINIHGNLALFGSNGSDPVWSTNISDASTGASSVAQLNDLGNLVLHDSVTGRVLWQSFDYPTNCLLPFMKLGFTRQNGLDRFLTSWKSPDDPGSGSFSYRINRKGFPQLILYQGLNPLWRTGTWTGRRWSGVPEMTNKFILTTTFVNNQDELSLMNGVRDNSILTRMELNETGMQQRFIWNARDQRWIEFWSAPKEQCDYYGHCGRNGYCDPSHPGTFECACLPGFEPKSPQAWFFRDASGGCTRKRTATACHSREGFVKLARIKVPDTSAASVDMGVGLKECKEKCLKNCSCVAYSSAYPDSGRGKGCLTWYGDMLDTRTYSGAGQDFFVRVDADELALWNENASFGKKRIAAILISSLAALVLVTGIIFWFIRRKRRAESKRQNDLLFTLTASADFGDSEGQELGVNERNRDLPFLELRAIAAATNNFSSDNKLGQGGFGPVYKGVLQNGIEIAVKRLSRCSGQGVEEFKNEIVLISKLQHRNLVRILGCCVEGEEKMLIYEFLPNKSLDSFIFDKVKRSQLDWQKRFEIVCGIARGILYLHQDSRLRIIHRDLKASNVLLDSAMNPKIADFGMARIFGGDQMEGSTNRIVGTYGYMSPEYAMEGQFSVKSDVYSFGVLLLEILTGRKNSSFYNENPSYNLVGHVWDLWNQGKATELVDKMLDEACPRDEVLRGIQIGLLCVQECASDRPTMSSVVFMLGNKATDLPSPKHPAFIMRRRSCNNGDPGSQSSEKAGSSVNDVTITVIQGR